MFSVVVQCEDPKTEAMALQSPKKDQTSSNGVCGSTVHFFAGNPSVHITKGVIHLLRDAEAHGIVHERGKLPKLTSRLILILAVPSYILVADFITWCGAFIADMDGMRVLSDASSQRYMVLANFREQKHADEFYLHYYGKEFSSLGDEVAYPVFAKGVDFVDSKSSIFPHQMEKELPTCPVCLERLDGSATGIVTILCNHYFHCHCLRKWREDNSCPVCRHVQQPNGSKTQCHGCGSSKALWICLVCGHVGCGRYVNSHAFQHFEQSRHTYALELETQRVWDYTSDGYVHRLVRNEADGKLIALPDPGMSGEEDPKYSKAKGKEYMGKLDALSLEYSYLLTAQLETQRDYFEKQLAMVHHQKTGKLAFMEDQYAQLLGQKIDCAKRLQTVESEKQRLKCRTKDLEKKMNDLMQESEFLRNVNKAMQENQDEYRKKIEYLKSREADTDMDKDKKIKELQEQVRDLMLYIEAKDKIEAMDQKEIKEGQVVSLSNPNVGNSTSSPKKRPKRKGRGRKR